MANSSKDDLWLGYDLGGTKMLGVLYDADFQELGRRRKKTKGNEGTNSVVSRIIRSIREVLAEAEIESGRLHGIGIGCPGPVDAERGVVVEAVNLGWRNVPLVELLQREFDCPVLLTNDVDAGVYGEYRFGAGRGARTVLGVFPGTGIGGGCVYDGEIVRGKGNSCVEIGHIRVRENGALCGCGLRGCLETEASRLAISAEAAKAVYRGAAPNLLESAGTDLANIRSGVLAKAIAMGDSVVEEIVRNAAAHLGTAMASFVHLFSPDVIVLGGGLAEAMSEIYLDAVGDAMESSLMASFRGTYEIRIAELGDDAVIRGTAAWAQRNTTKLLES